MQLIWEVTGNGDSYIMPNCPNEKERKAHMYDFD